MWVYSKEKSIDFKIGFKFIGLAIITAVLGAWLAHSIDSGLLRKLFSLYLIGVGVYFFIPRKEGDSQFRKARKRNKVLGKK